MVQWTCGSECKSCNTFSTSLHAVQLSFCLGFSLRNKQRSSTWANNKAFVQVWCSVSSMSFASWNSLQEWSSLESRVKMKPQFLSMRVILIPDRKQLPLDSSDVTLNAFQLFESRTNANSKSFRIFITFSRTSKCQGVRSRLGGKRSQSNSIYRLFCIRNEDGVDDSHRFTTQN